MSARRFILLVGLLFSPCSWGSAAEIKYDDESDFTFCAYIETDPEGVTLYTVTETNGVSTTNRIGITPCTLTAELTWGRWFKKKLWKYLMIDSLGNSMWAEKPPKSKNYDLFVGVWAEKAGYETMWVEQKVATLTPPGFAWDEKDFWPSRSTVSFYMVPKRKTTAQSAEDQLRNLPPIVYAKTKQGESLKLGTLILTCNERGAEVYLDGNLAGVTPIKLVLQENSYKIEVFKEGFTPYSANITIVADAEMILQTTLTK